MGIVLPTDRVQWLEQLVASGRFTSVEEALEAAMAALQAEVELDDSWAKPAVDEALAALDRSEGLPWNKGEALKRLHARYSDVVDGKTS